MNKKSLFILFTVLLSLGQQVKAENRLELIELNRNISVLESKKPDLSEKIQLARLYKNSGQDEKALKILNEILLETPDNSAALYLFGEIKRRNYDFSEAAKYFNKISVKQPEYKNSLIKLMEIATSLKDKDSAEDILKRTDKNDEVLYNTLLGIYNYSSMKLNPKEARKNFEFVLTKDPKQIESVYYLASINLDDNKRDEARKLFNQAIEQDFYFSNPHALLGFMEFIDGHNAKSVEELKTALELNPIDLRALTSHGNGMTLQTYEELEKDNANLKANEEFFAISRQAVNLVNLGKVNDAKNLINQLKFKYPNNIHTYIQAGSLFITLKDYKEAIKNYKKALAINPDYGVANNGLSISLRELIRTQEKNIKTLNLDLTDYSKINMDDLKKVFINYNDLTEKEKKILAYSVYQLKNYIPVLVLANSTHYIIPLYEKSTDYKFGQEFKNTRSFDGRLWDDIRGRGGLNSATGIEDFQTSVYLEFNTLAHEFAHQVHQYAFSKSQKQKIHDLYENANKNKLFMDYYAGSNEFEYFAQGIEAYTSDQGKLTLKATAKNTREFLKSKDKALYDFIEEVINKTDMKDNQAGAYVQIADNAFFESNYTGAIDNYKKAISITPENMDNYYLVANSYYQNGNIKDSIDNYSKIIKNDANSSYSYFGLASNYLLLGKLDKAKDNFEKGMKIDHLASDAYSDFSQLNLEMGKLDEAAKMAKNAIDFDKDNSKGFSSKSLIESAKLNLSEAISDADKAIELDPGNNLYKIRKAYILAASGATIKAYQVMKDVTDNYDKNEATRYEYNKDKNRYYYYNVKDIPTKAEYYYTLGYINENEGNIPEALNYYKKSIDILPYLNKTYKRLQTLLDNNKIDSTKVNEVKKSIVEFNNLTQEL